MSKLSKFLMVFVLISFSSVFFVTQDAFAQLKFQKANTDNLDEMMLYPGVLVEIFFEKDSLYELSDKNIRIIDKLNQYLKSNKNVSINLRGWQHENELPQTAQNRCDVIRKRILENGFNPSRVLVKVERPLIPQDPSDIFTEEELINARKVDIQIIR